jgi:DNA repair protein RadC
MEYFRDRMVESGASLKSDAELIALILSTAPTVYNTVTTMIGGRNLTENDLLEYTITQYRNY